MDALAFLGASAASLQETINKMVRVRGMYFSCYYSIFLGERI
ncbi:MAG: hypothetical protein ACJAUP_002633 [Cellvibrionaceae bacterium]|jgi:hypothetical protein